MAKIIWSDPALHDLEAIADYVALDRPEAARLLVERVFAAVQKHQKFPKLGSIPTELRGLPYRQLVISPCRVFYRVERKGSTSSILCAESSWFGEKHSLLNRARQNPLSNV